MHTEDILDQLNNTHAQLTQLREALGKLQSKELSAVAAPLAHKTRAIVGEASRLGAIAQSSRLTWPAPEVWANLTKRSGRPV